MKKIIFNFFLFTSRERNGAIVIAVLIAGITCVKLWLAVRSPGVEIISKYDIESRLTVIKLKATIAKEVQNKTNAFPSEDLFATPVLFYFDPNTATEDELLQLGIKKQLVHTIANYRSAGGRFYVPDDLKKIYGMTAGEYNRIEPYVNIEEANEFKESVEFDASTDRAFIELNEADTSNLMKLNGIGPVLASRIIKYRELLGGFKNTAQLKEVYGISESLFSRLQNFVYTDTTSIKKININLVTESELAGHPYIGSYYADGIIRYRQYADTIRSINELIENELLPDNALIKSYLTF